MPLRKAALNCFYHSIENILQFGSLGALPCTQIQNTLYLLFVHAVFNSAAFFFINRMK